MKKSDSLSRLCIIVSVITLLSTAVLTSKFSGLLPIFVFVTLLAVIPIFRGNRTQKILAAIIFSIAVAATSFALLAYLSERERFKRMRKTHISRQISSVAQFNSSFQSHSSLAFCTLNTFNSSRESKR
jgi:glucan phosphoethanolaminetransferase (alkaline phosphatase superfamily)